MQPLWRSFLVLNPHMHVNSLNISSGMWCKRLIWLSIHSFKCRQMYHAPTDCATIRKWLTKCADDSETANYISAHTKDVRANALRISKMHSHIKNFWQFWHFLYILMCCFLLSALSAISALKRTEDATTWWGVVMWRLQKSKNVLVITERVFLSVLAMLQV